MMWMSSLLLPPLGLLTGLGVMGRGLLGPGVGLPDEGPADGDARIVGLRCAAADVGLPCGLEGPSAGPVAGLDVALEFAFPPFFLMGVKGPVSALCLEQMCIVGLILMIVLLVVALLAMVALVGVFWAIGGSLLGSPLFESIRHRLVSKVTDTVIVSTIIVCWPLRIYLVTLSIASEQSRGDVYGSITEYEDVCPY